MSESPVERSVKAGVDAGKKVVVDYAIPFAIGVGITALAAAAIKAIRK